MEDFSAHYELWQNVKAQKYLEHIPEEIVDNFFKDTVVFAYLTLYKNFNLCREKHPELFLQTKEFWNKNRKEIASINRKFWLIVYVPFPFRLKGWIRKEFPKLWIVLRKCRRILGRNSEGKLFE